MVQQRDVGVFPIASRPVKSSVAVQAYSMYQFGSLELLDKLILSFLTNNKKEPVLDDLKVLRWNIAYI